MHDGRMNVCWNCFSIFGDHVFHAVLCTVLMEDGLVDESSSDNMLRDRTMNVANSPAVFSFVFYKPLLIILSCVTCHRHVIWFHNVHLVTKVEGMLLYNTSDLLAFCTHFLCIALSLMILLAKVHLLLLALSWKLFVRSLQSFFLTGLPFAPLFPAFQVTCWHWAWLKHRCVKLKPTLTLEGLSLLTRNKSPCRMSFQFLAFGPTWMSAHVVVSYAGDHFYWIASWRTFFLGSSFNDDGFSRSTEHVGQRSWDASHIEVQALWLREFQEKKWRGLHCALLTVHVTLRAVPSWHSPRKPLT